MKQTVLIIFVIFICITNSCNVIQNEPIHSSYHETKSSRDLRIMFYNVENLFDIYDDTLKNDEDFLPEGNYHWSEYKYYRKINNIAKVIIAAGEWEPIDIICLAEIENLYVLQGLTDVSALKSLGYNIIHKESNDRRGIDVAMLYREVNFKPLAYNYINYDKPEEKYYSREILHVEGIVKNSDTLHIFVNHWSSRYGGELASESKRILAAKVLRSYIDSLFSLNNTVKIVILGDFNDTPQNRSITENLKALSDLSTITASCLYNLTANLKQDVKGTHKYQGEWSILDQMIVSGSLITGAGLHTSIEGCRVFSDKFLLMNDDTYMGTKPLRTFYGFKYLGGFSDHLPVLLDLYD